MPAGGILQALETEMREVRSRCMRLVRVLRGGTVESPRGSMASSDGRQPWVGGDLEHDERGTWAEAGVLEASVAMEAGRRRALEEEIIRSVDFSASGDPLRGQFESH